MHSAAKYRSMQPKSGKNIPLHDYLYEQKYDGIRMLAGKATDASIELMSREQKPITAAFPELVAELAENPYSFVIDGEACIFIDGRPSLGAVTSRINGLRPSRKIWKIIPHPPAMLLAFDLLELDGEDCRQLPIEKRKALLKDLLPRKRQFIRCVEYTHTHGELLFKHARQLGAEGIVCKQVGSRYVEGYSDRWLKFKVAGYRPDLPSIGY